MVVRLMWMAALLVGLMTVAGVAAAQEDEVCMAHLRQTLQAADTACEALQPGQMCVMGAGVQVMADGMMQNSPDIVGQILPLPPDGVQSTLITTAATAEWDEYGLVLLYGQRENGDPGPLVMATGYTSLAWDAPTLESLNIETGYGPYAERYAVEDAAAHPCGDAHLGRVLVVTPEDAAGDAFTLNTFDGGAIANLSVNSGVQIHADDLNFAVFVLYGEAAAQPLDHDSRTAVEQEIVLAAADVALMVAHANAAGYENLTSERFGELLKKIDLDSPLRAAFIGSLWREMFGPFPEDVEQDAVSKLGDDILNTLADTELTSGEQIIPISGYWCIAGQPESEDNCLTAYHDAAENTIVVTGDPEPTILTYVGENTFTIDVGEGYIANIFVQSPTSVIYQLITPDSTDQVEMVIVR